MEKITIPSIDPSEVAKLADYVQVALVSSAYSKDHPETIGRRAVAIAVHAYRALQAGGGSDAIAKPGNKQWKQDPEAVEAVEYLLSIGFNYEDFLRADIEAGADHGS